MNSNNQFLELQLNADCTNDEDVLGKHKCSSYTIYNIDDNITQWLCFEENEKRVEVNIKILPNGSMKIERALFEQQGSDDDDIRWNPIGGKEVIMNINVYGEKKDENQSQS
jgi:hypothetical protein